MKTPNKIFFLVSFLVGISYVSKGQAYFKSYSSYLTNNFHKQSIDLSLGTIPTDAILNVGYTTVHDSSEKWTGLTRPYLTKTLYDGNLASDLCAPPTPTIGNPKFAFTYEINDGSINNLDADFSSVCKGDNGNYFVIGRTGDYLTAKLFVAEIDQYCGNMINIKQLAFTPTKDVTPLKLINYNGSLYCVGYSRGTVSFDWDMFILKMDFGLATFSTFVYQVGTEDIFPFDIVGRYNNTNNKHELVVVGELDKIQGFAGAQYDHQYAFFTVLEESTLDITDFKFYPYNISSTVTEGTWARTFTNKLSDNGQHEYFLPIMVDQFIGTKISSLLHLDETGNLIGKLEFDIRNNHEQTYPTSIHYVSDQRIIITAMAFNATSLYRHTLANQLDFKRIVKQVEVDYTNSAISDAKDINDPNALNNIYSYSSVYNSNNDELYISGTFNDPNPSSNTKFFQTMDVNDFSCYKQAIGNSYEKFDITSNGMALPTKTAGFLTISSSLSASKVRTELSATECIGTYLTGIYSSNSQINQSGFETIVVSDIMGREVLVLTNLNQNMTIEELKQQLYQKLNPNEIFMVTGYDKNLRVMESFKLLNVK